MKHVIKILFLVVTTGLFAQKNKEPFKFPGKLNEMKDMIFVPGGTFTMGRHTPFNPLKKDSNLLCSYVPIRVTCNNFYISNHEVTNKEYRQFVTWVQDSIKKKNGTATVDPQNTLYEYTDEKKVKHQINIFPDTTRWMNEFPYQYNDPMSTYYHKHPAYDDYPAVGISYNMAVAYCDWKTKQINLQMPKNTMLVIRIPAEGEWERAALFRAKPKKMKEEDFITDVYLYPWKNFSLTDAKGKYNANFGNIVDVNDLMIKSYMDDDAVYTSLAKSYVTNELGLYNMAGNVAEWTEWIPEMRTFTDSLDNKVEISLKDDINTVVNKLKKVSYLKQYDDKILESIALQYVHDLKIFQRVHDSRTVKGGSWADSPIYIQPGSKEVQNENYTSCRIGFRVAMDVFVFDEKDGL